MSNQTCEHGKRLDQVCIPCIRLYKHGNKLVENTRKLIAELRALEEDYWGDTLPGGTA